MILNKLNEYNSAEIPIVIFGSGPAGISTALELDKKNIKSLIIEAGNNEYSETSQKKYKGEIIGDKIIDLTPVINARLLFISV